jgi:hypothetical protein
MTVVSQHTEQNTTNFKVILKSEYKTVERYCQNIILPGVAVGKTVDPIGYTIVKQPGDKIEFDDLRFEILLDRELQSWIEIFNLMIEEVDPESGILSPTSVIFDTRIIMLDNTRNPFLEFQYINSFITKLDSFAVDTKKTENISFGVEMCFESIRINYLTRSEYSE